jgi:hypothetical protein
VSLRSVAVYQLPPRSQLFGVVVRMLLACLTRSTTYSSRSASACFPLR